MKTNTH